MKKQTGAAKTVITDAIVAQVVDVLEMATKHKYQASKVYAAHNAVFGLNETPEVCASCNKKRADALRKWFGEYKMNAVNQANEQANAEGQEITGNAAPALGVIVGDNANGSNAQTGAPDVPRETIGDLQAIYDRYVNRTEPQGEKEDIAQILEAHAADLSEEDALTLADRLAELSVDGDDEDAKGELADTVKPGTVIDTGENTANGQGAQDGSDAPNANENLGENGQDEDEGPLDLKNKKGEYFQANFISEDGVNGQLIDLEGASLKPGTYSTEMGDSYAVQPGGKATYKSDII